MNSFLRGQALLPAGCPGPLHLHPRQRRGRQQPTQSVVLAEAATTSNSTGGEEAAPSSSNGLLPRPERRLMIWRVPPSDRTLESKEKQQSERMEAQQSRYDDRRGRQDRGGAAPVRPDRFQGRGRAGGAPGVATAPAATAPARRGPGSAPGGDKWGGRGERRGPEARGGGRGDDRGRRKVPEEGGVESRRKARQSRKEAREERKEKAEREDIFEVGEEGMSLVDLSKRLAVSTGELLKALFMKGIMVSINSSLDKETVKAIAQLYDVDVLDREEAGLEGAAKKSDSFLDEGDLEYLRHRPPVVTVMGHVDHGKTSLLDFIRKSKVAAGEAGGITQAIGAYTCTVPYEGEDKQVTFLDTPGHEAFSAMRARGAKVTDIAIVIVAADDGVRPQTIEAISHANAAGVPIVVAINKIDKEGANLDRVKQELTEHGLLPEEWGGKTPMVPISAKKGNGVDALLETVLLVAELEDLQANPERPAKGTVLEASLDKKSGPVATLLVQAGTLRVGDIVAAGDAVGKVRTMRNPNGDVKEAGPSLAVQMTGLSGVPQAGDEFDVFATEAEARTAAYAVDEARRAQRLADMYGGGNVVTLSSTSSMDEDGITEMAMQRINIILKADASGSCEAVKAALSTLPQDSVMLRYLLAAPGEIGQTDLDLAVASQALVLGFNVSPSEAVMSAAKQRGVQLFTYNVIYDLVDDVRAAMEGRLKSVEERMEIGTAEVKAVFGSGNRRAAGCMVTDGALRKNCIVEVKRGKRIVYEGPLGSLRRVKDDVREVVAGTECGIACETFKEWQEGDKITAYETVEKKLKLEDAHADRVELDAIAQDPQKEALEWRGGRR